MVCVVENGQDIFSFARTTINGRGGVRNRLEREDSIISLLKSKYTLAQLQHQQENMMVPENAIGKGLGVVLRKQATAEETHRKNYSSRTKYFEKQCKTYIHKYFCSTYDLFGLPALKQALFPIP